MSSVLIRTPQPRPWLELHDPAGTLVAGRPDEVAGVLEAAQRAADQGLDAAAFRYSWGKPAANQLKPQTQFFHPGSASCTASKASRRWRSVSSRSQRVRATPGHATSLVSSMPTGLELCRIGMRL